MTGEIPQGRNNLRQGQLAWGPLGEISGLMGGGHGPSPALQRDWRSSTSVATFLPSTCLGSDLMICPQHNHLIFLGSFAGCMKAEHLSYCQGWTLGNCSLQAWVICLEQVLRNEAHRLWREQCYFRVGGEIKVVCLPIRGS